jgi:uncharacterized phiE125 gp8 family phage protein
MSHYSTTLVTAPTELPVSLQEAKNFLKLEDSVTEDDALVMALLRSAIEDTESFQNRKLITQTWDLKLDRFPCDRIWLPYGNLQSVTSISYVDTSGVTQTWSSSLYQVDTSGVLGSIIPVYGEVYPVTRYVLNAVTVRFVCGYGDDPADVPEATRLGILFKLREFYDKRGDGQDLVAAERLLSQQRIAGF